MWNVTVLEEHISGTPHQVGTPLENCGTPWGVRYTRLTPCHRRYFLKFIFPGASTMVTVFRHRAIHRYITCASIHNSTSHLSAWSPMDPMNTTNAFTSSSAVNASDSTDGLIPYLSRFASLKITTKCSSASSFLISWQKRKAQRLLKMKLTREVDPNRETPLQRQVLALQMLFWMR